MKYIKIILFTLIVVLFVTACSGSKDASSSTVGSTSGKPGDSTGAVNSDTIAESTEDKIPEPESSCKVTSFSISAEKNPAVYEDVTAEIEDNKIKVSVGLLCSTYALKDVIPDVETDGVNVSFSKETEGKVDLTDGCKVTVTDSDGLSRVYDVEICYPASKLPIVTINTSDGADVTTKEKYADATITIDTEGLDSRYELPEGFESIGETFVGIKGRGNSTWEWDKKPFKIKFDDKTSVLGLPKAKKWVLLANYADYSLIRNYIAFESTRVLSGELSPLHQYPVNLFLNGEYIGVYTIGEDKEVGKNRIDLEDDTGEADTSFLIEIGGYNDGDVLDVDYFMAGDVRWCTVEYPEDELTQEQFDFIKEYVLHVNDDIYFGDDWTEHIDIDSFVDWFISSELFYNLDSCFRRSCFMTKEAGGKLKMGPVWDFDLSMGNIYMDYGLHETWMCTTQEYEYIQSNWYQILLEDETFRARLKERWDEKKDELLERSLSCVDTMGALVSPSAEYNFTVWDIMGERKLKVQPTFITDLKTYDSHIEYVRNFIINRWNWMDENI